MPPVPTGGPPGAPGGLPAAVILAAGKGKRMRSDLPKVVHPVGGRAMVCAVVDACLEVGCDPIVVVVGHGREHVERALEGYAGVRYAFQEAQLGTGHAVRCAREVFEGGEGGAGGAGALPRDGFVLAGDGPLIRAATLRKLLGRHRGGGGGGHATASLATSVIDDPTGYGRIVRDAEGRFAAIVEEKECTPEQLAIREVNPSYYCFDLAALFVYLERLRPSAGSGEYYVTDVPAMMLADGLTVEVVDAVPPEDVLSINTPEQLAEVDRIYRARRGRVEAGVGGSGGGRGT